MYNGNKQAIIKLEKINADILLEVEKFILHNKLSENLVENNIKEKKLKI